ncbi:hypothetical protein DL764_009233 [Monosporascus ibericus]|uniref:Uncharacterized protein n=1 Tax=Monosporascus ibericus TaxID=155417 RepID=A0A4Q4SYA0_9PEZI|nr:hypothetical protein DL764_009233 [Monosporascus ibericus]
MLVETRSLEWASLATAITTRIPEASTGTYPSDATTTGGISETNSIPDSCKQHSRDFADCSQRGTILSSGTKRSRLRKLDAGFLRDACFLPELWRPPSSSVKDDETTTLISTTILAGFGDGKHVFMGRADEVEINFRHR